MGQAKLPVTVFSHGKNCLCSRLPLSVVFTCFGSSDWCNKKAKNYMNQDQGRERGIQKMWGLQPIYPNDVESTNHLSIHPKHSGLNIWPNSSAFD